MHHCRLTILLVLLLGLSVVSLGCEEDVTNVTGSDGAFSLYGVLLPNADTQWVRVYPVKERLKPLPAEALAARFTSTDRQTGGTRVWRDSIIQGENELNAHVFWSPFRAQYGHTYNLKAKRSDGQASGVTVDVPARTEIKIRKLTNKYPVRLPLFVPHAPRLINVRPEYYVRYDPSPDALTRIVLPESISKKRKGNGWQLTLNLSRAHGLLTDILRESGLYLFGYGIQLKSIRLELIVANNAWNPPDGTFDPDVLSYPGTLTNVDNGFGFVGAGYSKVRAWLPPQRASTDSALVKAGFRTSR